MLGVFPTLILLLLINFSTSGFKNLSAQSLKSHAFSQKADKYLSPQAAPPWIPSWVCPSCDFCANLEHKHRLIWKLLAVEWVKNEMKTELSIYSISYINKYILLGSISSRLGHTTKESRPILCKTETNDEYFLCCWPNKYLYRPRYLSDLLIIAMQKWVWDGLGLCRPGKHPTLSRLQRDWALSPNLFRGVSSRRYENQTQHGCNPPTILCIIITIGLEVCCIHTRRIFWGEAFKAFYLLGRQSRDLVACFEMSS